MGEGFRGGVPYALDLKRLREAFPVPTLTEGRVIKHGQLETVVNVKKGASRYYAVVDAWRAELKNNAGIFVVWERAVGLKVLNPAELLNHAETRTRQKIRQTGKAIRTFAWVDRNRLDDTGKARLDHQVRVANVVRDALDSAKKELAVSLAPVKSLPRPKVG